MNKASARLISVSSNRYSSIARLTLAMIFLIGSVQAQTGQQKISPDLQTMLLHADKDQPVEVIVQYNQQTLIGSLLGLIANLGGVLLGNLQVINGAHYLLPASSIAQVAGDPNVAYVTLNRTIHLNASDRFIQTVGADIARANGWTGAGISVAVIDSGISSHPDLRASNGQSRVVYNESFVSGEGPQDLYGHGTHVAGIIAGNGFSSRYDGHNAVTGVAADVHIVNLKALSKDGSGSDSSVINAIARAIALKDRYNIKVINLSLGRPVSESYLFDPLDRAVEAAYQAGIVVVVSAGNNGRNDALKTNGYGTINSPGNDPNVITVGASNTLDTDTPADDRIATYSSKGPTPIDQIVKPDLVAPGNKIVSLMDPGSTLAMEYPQDQDMSQTSGAYSYFTLSGTSMAAPVVSGAAALMLQKSPAISPDTVKARMMKTAFKKLSPGYYWYDPDEGDYRYEQQDIFATGAGLLNIPAALASTTVAHARAASPFARRLSDHAVVLTSNPQLGVPPTGLQNLVTLLFGPAPIWDNSIIWGSTGDFPASIVWGSQIDRSSAIWGSSIIWGSGNPAGDSIIWGSGNSQADSIIWGQGSNDYSEEVAGSGDSSGRFNR